MLALSPAPTGCTNVPSPISVLDPNDNLLISTPYNGTFPLLIILSCPLLYSISNLSSKSSHTNTIACPFFVIASETKLLAQIKIITASVRAIDIRRTVAITGEIHLLFILSITYLANLNLKT